MWHIFKETYHKVLLWNFFHDLWVIDFNNRPIMMYCDNSTKVSFSNNLKGTPRARYIDLKFFKVQKKVAKGLIIIGGISLNQRLAIWHIWGAYVPYGIVEDLRLHGLVRVLQYTIMSMLCIVYLYWIFLCWVMHICIWIIISICEMFNTHIVAPYIYRLVIWRLFSLFICMLIHIYHGEFLPSSLSMLWYPIGEQCAWMKWNSITENCTW